MTKHTTKEEFLREFHLESREDGVGTTYNQVGEAMADWWLERTIPKATLKKEIEGSIKELAGDPWAYGNNTETTGYRIEELKSLLSALNLDEK